jgi:tRNA threonylcarbamoyladenosine biosynthesis protein TsaE
MLRKPPPAPPRPCALHWRTEADTAACAARLAAALADGLAAPLGQGSAFIALQGELGAGKTTFVRYLLRALGVTGRVKSPTYAVVEPHQTPGGLAVSHFDFYRFNDPREWEDAGLRDLFAAPGLKLAEWPEQAAGLLPAPDLALRIQTQADAARAVTLTAFSALGQRLLAGVAAEVAA